KRWVSKEGADMILAVIPLMLNQEMRVSESGSVSGNVAVVARFLEEVINQGRLEHADELVAVDFVELDPLPGQQQGREGLKQVIGAFRTAFPDIHWEIEELIGEGEKVFSRFTWHGTHRGEFFGVPATGKQIKVKGMVVDRVVAGRMAESRILMDGLSMMRQLGVIPE